MEGGETGVNSGRFWRWKRDGKLWEFLIEARTTEANSYSIQRDEFLAIEREAKQTPPGLLPGMQIDIRNLSLMVIRLNDFQQMELEMEALRSRAAIPEPGGLPPPIHHPVDDVESDELFLDEDEMEG